MSWSRRASPSAVLMICPSSFEVRAHPGVKPLIREFSGSQISSTPRIAMLGFFGNGKSHVARPAGVRTDKVDGRGIVTRCSAIPRRTANCRPHRPTSAILGRRRYSLTGGPSPSTSSASCTKVPVSATALRSLMCALRVPLRSSIRCWQYLAGFAYLSAKSADPIGSFAGPGSASVRLELWMMRNSRPMSTRRPRASSGGDIIDSLPRRIGRQKMRPTWPQQFDARRQIRSDLQPSVSAKHRCSTGEAAAAPTAHKSR
jgi:hypothetical protein